MPWTGEVDSDGVGTIYKTLTGGTTYALGSKNPNTESAVSLDEGGTAEEHTGSTTHVHYWIYTGGPVNYASGGSGRTCRVTLKPSGAGPQQFNWRNGAITNGFILNNKDVKNSEFTIYMRVEGALAVHTECSMKLRGGVHSSNDDGTPDPRASCTELRVPLAGHTPQAARELDHPNYDFVDLTPKFTFGITENVWFGIKTISINNADGKSTTNQMWIDPNPFDATGKPANNWQLYTEWVDSSDVSTGQYKQSATWAGWLYTCRVDGWSSINFSLPSIREIDPSQPTINVGGGTGGGGTGPCAGKTCPAGTHLNTTTCNCDPDPVTCPSGQVFSTQFNKCIPICASGQHYDDNQGKCVDNNIPDPTCPTGFHLDPISRTCVPDPTDKIKDNALQFYYSGGGDTSEATASRSTGGFISNVPMISGDLNNLFQSINGPEVTQPGTQYRCIYVKNISEQTAYSVRAYLYAPNDRNTGTLSPDTRVRAGLGAQGKNRIELFLADPTKPPLGVCIASYYDPVSKYMWLGKMFPNETQAIWIERRSKANLKAWSRDQTQLIVLYDESLHDPLDIPNLCAEGANDIPCPTGQHFDFALNQCVSDGGTLPPCPTGQHRDINGNCVPDDTGPAPCPAGTHFDSNLGQCVPDTAPPGVVCPPGSHFESASNSCVPDEINLCNQTAALSVSTDSVAQLYAPSPVMPSEEVDTHIFEPGIVGPINTATTAAPVGLQIYKAKPGGRIFTVMNDTGGNCQSDGIRWNFEFNDCHVYNRETTFLCTVENNPNSCTDKPHWSPKIGSHDHSDSSATLVECSFDWDGGGGGFRTETGNSNYNGCSGGHHGTIPKVPYGTKKTLGFKTAVYKTTHTSLMFEFWIDWVNEGRGPWTKLAWIDWGADGKCLNTSTPPGFSSSCWPGDPSGGLQDTWRANGATSTFIGGQMIEIMEGGVLNDGSSGPPPCPPGTHDDGTGNCVADTPPPGTTCPTGFHDDGTGHCVPDTPPPTGCPGSCPPGQHFDSHCVCIDDNPPPPDTGSSPFLLDTTNYLAPGTNNRLRGEPTSQTITDHNSVQLTQDLALGIMTDTVYSPSKILTYDQSTLTANKYMMDPRDWRNTEFTLYFMGKTFSAGAYLELQLRGGVHTTTAGQTCEATGYKVRIFPTGKVILRKQLEQTAESDINTDPTVANAFTQAMQSGRFVGIKFIVFDEHATGKTDIQVHIDDSTDNNAVIGNHFRRVVLFKDDGTNWAVQGTPNCNGTNKTQIVWGGPLANIVTSGFTNYELKNISVREITSPC